MKNIVYIIIALFIISDTNAQTEGSAFTLTGRGASTTFASDYQALGINPANLGYGINNGNKRIALGTSEFGFSTSSKLFNNDVIKNVRAFPLNFEISNSFSFDEFKEVSTDLQDGFVLNANFRWLGAAMTIKGIGTFAFSMNDNYQMNFNLSEDFADIATFGFGAPYFDSLVINSGGSFSKVENTPNNYDSLQNDTSVSIVAGTSSNPKSIKDLIEGTNMSISWLREWNVGYGRQLISTEDGFGVYVGAGLKYIQGIAMFDLGVENNQLSAFGAYSPSFSGNGNTGGFIGPGAYRFGFPKAAGSGFGLDLGANVKIKNVIKIGAAVNNIGSVKWTKNTFTALGDSVLSNFTVGGFYYDSSSVQNGSGSATFDSVTNALIKIQNTNVSRTVPLASTMRLGIGFHFKKLEIGADIVMPFNKTPGSIDKAIIALGGDLKLGPIRLSTGAVFGGNYLTRVPFGIVFAPASGTWEAGISTRDVLSLVQFNSVEKPILSASLGFARFKF